MDLAANWSLATCPSCLVGSNPSQPRLVYGANHECGRYSRNPALQPVLCTRKLYECGGDDGALIYLPPYTSDDLSKLYAVYVGQRHLTLTHIRPVAQAALIKQHVLDQWHHRRAVHVVEIGCAGAYMLAILSRSMRAGRITCFEADAKMANSSERMLDEISRHSGGNISTRLIRSFFNASLLLEENDLADVFASSHVVEHISDPCPWLADVHRILRSGGFVMTEVPDQYQQALADQKRIRGQFHATYFNARSFDHMMTNAGFVLAFNESCSWSSLRFMHRKMMRPATLTA